MEKGLYTKVVSYSLVWLTAVKEALSTIRTFSKGQPHSEYLLQELFLEKFLKRGLRHYHFLRQDFSQGTMITMPMWK